MSPGATASARRLYLAGLRAEVAAMSAGGPPWIEGERTLGNCVRASLSCHRHFMQILSGVLLYEP